VRLFLAINLPAEVRREVDAAAAPMRECIPELSWVPESRLHLTLKFLGEQPAERVDEIHSGLAGVAARHRELFVALGEIGAFPNFRRARVVWMGVNHDPRLELLHHDVEMACERLGFELDARAFRPHLTLARVKHAMPEERMRAFARVAKRTDYRSDFIVRSIDLMQSVLGASGSTYTTLVSAALRS
jgi:RNA 2',3'-cyclic 3'-phosphodiesterase